MSIDIPSEAAFAAFARSVARSWRDGGLMPAIVALEGDLGAGKTTFVRAALRGLGYEARVPSPTFTLLEHYALEGLNVVHLDLYRLAGSEEFEYLGVRDWLADASVWMFVEWPERAPQLLAGADLVVRIDILPGERRRISLSAGSKQGDALLEALAELNSSNPS